MPDMIRTMMLEQKNIYEEQIAQLRAERDEARRKVCEMEAECIWFPPCSPQQYAVRMGWDCFPEKTEADSNNSLFRTTDGE